ncbi:stage II sporulation protein E [Halobacillus litoralis]|uniref:Stage II sporulation protein E n=1 Tax=Halobacillus litoralis TaxID=45668 RepID=A0A845DWB5_9BACI|nr:MULTISPECIES: stage II sporulation protein E [Halobacillus]MCA1024400.1 stage II sporulation protein E [Halobacillus litoralis]MYL21983.1 stage II sporulation protein E [Halobacillus litoralis]MYL31949.1 stage II sporulation protein E [Halobacillus halophilus]MYL39783.1 stage II sporulation protein E [Halobacillus litoralis]
MLETVSKRESRQSAVRNSRMAHGIQRASYRTVSFMADKGVFHMVLALLLGRAIILSSMAPFGVAFLSVIWWMKRPLVIPVTIMMAAGASTYSYAHAGFIVGASTAFLLLSLGLRRTSHPQKWLPALALMASLIPRTVSLALLDRWQLYEITLMAAEGILSFILVLIFMQSIPILTPQRFQPTLKNEEIVCLIILLASVLTGLIGWQIQGVAVVDVFARYLVILLAYIAGAAIGSTVGVVTGLVLSLSNMDHIYQMSLLAFSGLLGGLLKEGKKAGVSAGLVVGTLLIGFYMGSDTELPASLWATAWAVALFVLTPNSWVKQLSKYVPGTDEHFSEQQKYLQKVRDVTAVRVGKFSDVFQALSRSFTYLESPKEESGEAEEIDYFLSHVTEKTCQSCFMKEKCWVRNFDDTHNLMTDLMHELDEKGEAGRGLRKSVDQHCVKPQKLIDTMNHELSFYHANRQLKRQVLESRRFVAEQLQGVSEVMDNFAQEIVKEREHHEKKEHVIYRALERMGMSIQKLEIYSLDEGNMDLELIVEIDNYRGEGAKIIAPVLSDILGETIVVTMEEISPYPQGRCYLSFGSAKHYAIESGVAHAAKGGGFVSGDSFTMMELGRGKYALAISDGMGNGERAHEESMETLRLLKQILQSGIQESAAIQSINSILSLRTNDEIFSTLDLAVIDLHQATSKFIKVGSTPSFIKRGDKIHTVEAGNLPMGIIPDVDVDVRSEQLKAGDFLIMMSDGILEAPRQIENVEMWIKRKIREISSQDPQVMADLLLEEVIRTHSGDIVDDMTIIVARIDHYLPEWASIPSEKKEA